MKSIDTGDGAALLDLRRRLGMTQEALARRLGTTVVQVDRWEHGYTRLGKAEQARLAAAAARAAA